MEHCTNTLIVRWRKVWRSEGLFCTYGLYLWADLFANLLFFQVKISPHLLEVKEEKENEAQNEIPQQLGIKDIFKNPDTRKFTLVMWINWIVVTLGYYGISMGASNLGGDVFVSSILISLIEIPSYVFTILLMDHWGRKPMFVR